MDSQGWIDLRSDTVTRPGPEMRRAMAWAEVGDDVYGEDPTARELESLAAALIGFEAALFVPSGTMANQIAIHLLAPRGSDVLLEQGTHVYLYELGAMAAWSGVLARPLPGEAGLPTLPDLRRALPPLADGDLHPSLLVLENSHNHAGGIPVEPERQAPVMALARQAGLALHLDGARLFNAAVALQTTPDALTRGFDSAMFCLSKGLGAPVGSLLAGSTALIREARLVRKRLGGGMRQVGILAAAGLFALERQRGRLHEDHERAASLARAVAGHPWFELDAAEVRTNILIAGLRPPHEAGPVLAALREQGILAGTMGPGRIRFVTHLDIDDAAMRRVFSALDELARRRD